MHMPCSFNTSAVLARGAWPEALHVCCAACCAVLRPATPSLCPAAMRCLAFKLPAEGVTTAVPHNFKVLQGLSDPALMQQWREAAHDSTASDVDISSVECSSAGSSSAGSSIGEDSGSEDGDSLGVKRPGSMTSIDSSCGNDDA